MSRIKTYKDFSEKRVLIIHGYNTNANECFYPWLKKTLTKMGYVVDLPNLPNPTSPDIDEQVNYILENYPNKQNIILAHSWGSCIAMKLIEKLDYKIDKLILVSGFCDNNFSDDDDGLDNACDWNFNFQDVKSKCDQIINLRPLTDTAVSLTQTKALSKSLEVPITKFKEVEDHACGDQEPELLKYF